MAESLMAQTIMENDDKINELKDKTFCHFEELKNFIELLLKDLKVLNNVDKDNLEIYKEVTQNFIRAQRTQDLLCRLFEQFL